MCANYKASYEPDLKKLQARIVDSDQNVWVWKYDLTLRCHRDTLPLLIFYSRVLCFFFLCFCFTLNHILIGHKIPNIHGNATPSDTKQLFYRIVTETYQKCGPILLHYIDLKLDNTSNVVEENQIVELILRGATSAKAYISSVHFKIRFLYWWIKFLLGTIQFKFNCKLSAFGSSIIWYY